MLNQVIISQAKGCKFDRNEVYDFVYGKLDDAKIPALVQTCKGEIIVESNGRDEFNGEEVYGFLLNELENEAIDARIEHI